mmetsp:Transcript_5579/g.13134  ORF Transcript_5579/g.13134 Transcript_5579/m.13134 type:complete len:328 (-) Transcript_5579:509-1492(-)
MPPHLDPSTFDHSLFPAPSSQPDHLQDVVDFWFPLPASSSLAAPSNNNADVIAASDKRSQYLNDISYVESHIIGWMMGGEVMDEKCRQFRSLVRLAGRSSKDPDLDQQQQQVNHPPDLMGPRYNNSKSPDILSCWILDCCKPKKKKAVTIIQYQDGTMNERATLIAKTILFDQITRNAFRCEEEAFAYDALVLEILHDIFGVEKKQQNGQNGHLADKNLKQFANAKDVTFCECFFVSVACQHQEEPMFHDVCERLTDLMEVRWPAMKDFLKLAHSQARSHLEVLNRFGRYPHRNHIKGRKDTAEERAWLDDYDNLPAWAKSQFPKKS